MVISMGFEYTVYPLTFLALLLCVTVKIDLWSGIIWFILICDDRSGLFIVINRSNNRDHCHFCCYDLFVS